MDQSSKGAYSGSFVFLSAIFTACLVISNIIAGRLINIGPFVLPAAVLVFPLTYILGDIFTEVYGYKKARLVIWTGFAANCLLVLISVLTILLPAPVFFEGAAAYKAVLTQTPRTVIASLLAFWCGEFLNSFVLSKMKTATEGRLLPVRTIVSTLAGQAVDSSLFLTIAFAFSMPWTTLLIMILTQYIFKVAYEALFTPLTVLTVRALKKHEGLDVFDKGISYNHFEILGQNVSEPRRQLETFPTPKGVTNVTLESDEVTSLCPVTGQPDWERVRIEFVPGELCLESKSLKLYLWSFRNEGHFCEALAARIASDIVQAIKPNWIKVSVFQKARGGITITAVSESGKIPQ